VEKYFKLHTHSYIYSRNQLTSNYKFQTPY
jgi:hypothetical protein